MNVNFFFLYLWDCKFLWMQCCNNLCRSVLWPLGVAKSAIRHNCPSHKSVSNCATFQFYSVLIAHSLQNSNLIYSSYLINMLQSKAGFFKHAEKEVEKYYKASQNYRICECYFFKFIWTSCIRVKNRPINTATRPLSSNQFRPIQSDQNVSEPSTIVSFVNHI